MIRGKSTKKLKGVGFREKDSGKGGKGTKEVAWRCTN